MMAQLLLGWFFCGICFLACGLVAGSRPAWANRFMDDAADKNTTDYFSSTLLPKMLRKGHCRRALPEEIPQCFVHTSYPEGGCGYLSHDS